MSFREFVDRLTRDNVIVSPRSPLSRRLEAAAYMKAVDGRPALVRLKESPLPVVANICSTRELVAKYLGIHAEGLVRTLLRAIEHPTKPTVVDTAPALEASSDEVNLDEIPLLFHCPGDGGYYITSGIVIASHSSTGQNVSFHRLMQIDKDSLAIRIVPRHLHEILTRSGGEVDVAVSIGNPPNVLMSAACSVELGLNELEIANALKPLSVTWLDEINCTIPAESEFTLVGRITRQQHDEGPFVDLTETYDVVRKQPILKIRKVYHRKNPFYQALLPGGPEHKLLMGTPREATIMREVLKVCRCLDVSLTAGGCSWLHGVVRIDKKDADDGPQAIEAAFKGHPSMKHVVIVDSDINIQHIEEVEWAIATRFQADRGLTVRTAQVGSSLDPSADPHTRLTTKVGIDATKPAVVRGKSFEKATYISTDARHLPEWRQ